MDNPKHEVPDKVPAQRPGRNQPNIHEALKAQPDWLRDEVEGLRKHEGNILKALEQEEEKARFISDPAGFLGRLGIPISGQLRQRLRGDPTLNGLAQPPTFRLPDGRVLTPRVRVRFTKEER